MRHPVHPGCPPRPGMPRIGPESPFGHKAGLSRAPEFADGYAYLAQAYGWPGHIGEADLASAEGHFYSGNYHEAKVFALRAQNGLKHGSPGWLRARDIVNYQPVGKGG